MSDQVRRLSNIKWVATGVEGHTHHTCAEWMYTSDAPPVEAEEYERMKQRAEAAEGRVKELENTLEDAPSELADVTGKTKVEVASWFEPPAENLSSATRV